MSTFLEKTAEVIKELKRELITERRKNEELSKVISEKKASERIEKIKSVFPNDVDLISSLASMDDSNENIIDNITSLKKNASFATSYDNNNSVNNPRLEDLRRNARKAILG